MYVARHFMRRQDAPGRTVRRPGRVLSGACCLLVAVAAMLPAVVHADMRAALRAEIEKAVHGVAALPQAVEAEGIRSFYADRDFSPVWTTDRGLTARGQEALDSLARAAAEGLDPRDYALSDASPDGRSDGDIAAARREVAVAGLIAKYAGDVADGRGYIKKVEPELFVFKQAVETSRVLRAAAAAPDMAAFFATLPPSGAAYAALRDLLAAYRRIAAAGGWPSVGGGAVLKPGLPGSGLAALHERLRITGDIDTGPSSSGLYDGALVDAVIAFQKRHGLTGDGIVGARTRDALNVPADLRVRQIVLNMERLRWSPDALGDPHVEVNLAGFELTAVRDGKVALRMPVIIGTPFRRTPVFSDRISYLVLNPTWSVPRSIATQDILPRIKRSPHYLADNGIRVIAAGGAQIDPGTLNWSKFGADHFPFRFEQAAGPKNALGQVKFMFPNRFAVYLHDTPARELFSRDVRTFSSGCIRVAQPVELAAFLLNGTDWRADGVEREIETGKTRTLRIARPVPVHLTYRTAWAGADGKAQFRDDVYGRDRLLAAALISGR